MSFPLRHFWPLALVGAAAVGAAALLFWPSPRPAPAEWTAGASVVTGAAGGVEGTASTALLVTSDPIGASIAIDGVGVGTTPLLVENVRVGTRQVALSRRGFARLDTALAVTPWSTLRAVLTPARAPLAPAPSDTPVQAAAEPAPPPAPPPSQEPGRIAVTVRPWGTIAIDGEVRRRDADVTFETPLSAGTHRVSAVHPTLGQVEQTVTVRPGETLRLTLNLNER